jgi:hypothetical protein
MSQDIAATLEICLKEITAGKATVQQCLDRYHDLADELEPLLRAAKQAQTIERPRLAAEARARIEARLLAAAESSPPIQPAWTSRPTIALIRRWAAIGLAFLFAYACLLGTGLVMIARGALPGSQLYPVKLATEDARLWLAPTQNEAALHLQFAQQRLDEIQALAERGRFDVTVLTALTEETAAALDSIETLPPEAAEPVLQDVLRVTAEQQRVLSALMAGAPPLERGESACAFQASSVHQARAVQLMATLRSPEEPGKSEQATPAPGPTSSAETTALPGPLALSSTPTPAEAPRLTATARLPTTPGLTTTPQPTQSPEPTSVPLPTKPPTARPQPGTTAELTEAPPPTAISIPPTETFEPAKTSIPPATITTASPPTATPGNQSCVCGPGYWKNHPDVWPVNSLALGNETYTQAELADLLSGPTRGDTSLILAQQLIAAKLNITNGADNSTIAATIAAANTWFASYTGNLPYNVSLSLPEGQEAVAMANTLEQYNNGILPGGPPNCP